MKDEKFFTAIYETHYPKVFMLCKGYVAGDVSIAHDLCQEVFIAVWNKLETFRQESAIGTWIYRIAVNTCLMYHRKRKNHAELSETMAEKPSDPTKEAEDLRLHQMYQCIHSLKETDRVIILMVLDGLEYEEIANIVGASEGTLRVKISRIKARLSKCVQND